MPKATPPTRCRHCARRRPLHRRGLCRGCYYAAGGAIREQHKRDARNAPKKTERRGVVLPTPTQAEPGTEAKIQVFIARHEARDPRQHLFHPDDLWHDRRNVPADD
jgi:hypothetical protein